MLHCAVKVKHWHGETVKGVTNIPSEFENGDQLNQLIKIENELRLIAQEFFIFEEKCKASNKERYCEVTLEVVIDEMTLVPAKTVKVPSTEEGDLRKLLCHIKDVCIDQMQEFLAEERKDKEIKRVAYQLPAFFIGNIYSTVFH